MKVSSVITVLTIFPITCQCGRSKSPAKDVTFSLSSATGDDYDKAEGKIFKVLEDAEKSVLDAVEHVIHDEVDVLFRDRKTTQLVKEEEKSKKSATRKKDVTKETTFVRKETNENDFDAAEQAVFNAVENTEKAIIHAAERIIHNEVDVLFHSQQKPLKEGEKSKNVTNKKDEKGKTAFVRKENTDNDEFDTAERAVFDAVENAEKAIIHAAENVIHDEVDVLFHDLPQKETLTKRNKVQTTNKKPAFVKYENEHDRAEFNKMAEKYIKCVNFD